MSQETNAQILQKRLEQWLQETLKQQPFLVWAPTLVCDGTNNNSETVAKGEIHVAVLPYDG